jgi:hypothetical protein
VLTIDGESPFGIAAFQGGERGVPGDVAVQDAGSVVARQPACDQLVGLLASAALVYGVRERVHPIGVVPAEITPALCELTALRDRTILGMRPAPVGQEPPVIGLEVPGMALAEVHARLVVVCHAGEGEQSEGTQRQGEDQDIAGPNVGMRERPLQRLGQLAMWTCVDLVERGWISWRPFSRTGPDL